MQCEILTDYFLFHELVISGSSAMQQIFVEQLYFSPRYPSPALGSIGSGELNRASVPNTDDDSATRTYRGHISQFLGIAPYSAKYYALSGSVLNFFFYFLLSNCTEQPKAYLVHP